MEDPKPTNNKTCSCRQNLDCPLNQNCLSECLVYKAVEKTFPTKKYYGTCEKSFRERERERERKREREITITRHHLETNHVRKVQSFLTT